MPKLVNLQIIIYILIILLFNHMRIVAPNGVTFLYGCAKFFTSIYDIEKVNV